MNTEKAKKLYELRRQKEALDVEIASIAKDVLEDMKAEGLTEVKFEGLVVTVSKKETIKYLNEGEIIKFLDSSKDTAKYIERSIKTTSLNNQLKKGGKLAESLKDFYTKNPVEYVTVTTEENKEKQEKHIEAAKAAKEAAKEDVPDFAKYLAVSR